MKRAALSLVLACASGCAVTPNFPVNDQRMIYTPTPWRECDHLYGTLGKFLDAAGCYRAVREGGRWVCYAVVGLKPNNLRRQEQTEAHERRHCREGNFHAGDSPDVVFMLAD